jgi:hypothetical protein
MSVEDIIKLLSSFKLSISPMCVDSVVNAILMLKWHGIHRTTIEMVINDIKEGIICSFMYAVKDGAMDVRGATYYLMDVLKRIESEAHEIIRYEDARKLKDLITKLFFKLLNIPRYDYYVVGEWDKLQKIIEKEEKGVSGE